MFGISLMDTVSHVDAEMFVIFEIFHRKLNTKKKNPSPTGVAEVSSRIFTLMMMVERIGAIPLEVEVMALLLGDGSTTRGWRTAYRVFRSIGAFFHSMRRIVRSWVIRSRFVQTMPFLEEGAD